MLTPFHSCAIFQVLSCESCQHVVLWQVSRLCVRSGVACNVAAGILASKVAPVWFFVVGSVTTVTANVLYAVMDVDATYFTYEFFAQMLCVVGPDVTVVMSFVYLTLVVPIVEIAVAAASLQFFVALGAVCGPSLSTLIYLDLVKHENERSLTQAESRKNPGLLSSLRASFWLWAALGFTCESIPFAS